MEGYELFRKDRDIQNEKGNDKKGGGVLIYVESELNSTDRTDFENSSFKECKWVDIHVEKWKKNWSVFVIGHQ